MSLCARPALLEALQLLLLSECRWSQCQVDEEQEKLTLEGFIIIIIIIIVIVGCSPPSVCAVKPVVNVSVGLL